MQQSRKKPVNLSSNMQELAQTLQDDHITSFILSLLLLTAFARPSSMTSATLASFSVGNGSWMIRV